jgi:hypothetical protein
VGTDIPLALVEKKIGNTWMPDVDHIWPDPGTGRMRNYPAFTREYELFSILADVRNRSGRGTKTEQPLPPEIGGVYVYDTDDGGHDTLTPISNPKGVPADASLIWTLGLTVFDLRLNLHDMSYLTLEELTTDLWDQQIYRDAYLLEEEYLALQRDGIEPTTLARGTNPENVVNEVEYAAGKRGENGTAIFTRWRAQPLRSIAPWFFRYLEIMKQIAPDGDPRKVRLLIAFDS